MVAERRGDSRYPQRTVNKDGSYSVALSPDTVTALREQLAAFRAKFGRDAEPHEPIFFDPDADEPTPISPECFDSAFRDAAGRTDDPGLRASLLAAADLGYVVTEVNEHLFSAQEVEAFESTVLRHLEESETDLNPATFLSDQVAGVVELIVDGNIDPEAPRDILNRLFSGDVEISEENLDLIGSLMFGIPLGWLLGAKEAGVAEPELDAAVAWTNDNVGDIHNVGPASVLAAAIWGTSEGSFEEHLGTLTPTVEDVVELLGDDLVPAMIWLCAGLVATIGAGDIAWLRQFDLAGNAD